MSVDGKQQKPEKNPADDVRPADMQEQKSNIWA